MHPIPETTQAAPQRQGGAVAGEQAGSTSTGCPSPVGSRRCSGSVPTSSPNSTAARTGSVNDSGQGGASGRDGCSTGSNNGSGITASLPPTPAPMRQVRPDALTPVSARDTL
ncbi:hypothetical protein I552_1250 [Mycobacterium xenopi 3993]|nr:hypothetical protein I552_1250 [Mycobacterium xenopi 3993]